VGCHRQVGYPVDRVFERKVFELFCRQLQTSSSTARRLCREGMSRVPRSGTAWHLQRGGGWPGGAPGRGPACELQARARGLASGAGRL